MKRFFAIVFSVMMVFAMIPALDAAGVQAGDSLAYAEDCSINLEPVGQRVYYEVKKGQTVEFTVKSNPTGIAAGLPVTYDWYTEDENGYPDKLLQSGTSPTLRVTVTDTELSFYLCNAYVTIDGKKYMASYDMFCTTDEERTDISGAEMYNYYNGTELYAGYTGSPILYEPDKIEIGGWKELTLGEDYTLSYRNNVKCGEATVIATGVGQYKGTLERTFYIQKCPKELKETVNDDYSLTLDMGVNEPVTSVRIIDREECVLTEGKEYRTEGNGRITLTSEYLDSQKWKGAKAMIDVQTEDYCSKYCEIYCHDITNLGTENINYSDRVYNGSKRYVSPWIYDWVKGTDFTVSYASSTRTKIGTYTFYINGKGYFKGRAKCTFKIRPKMAALSSLTYSKTKKSFSLKWKKVSNCDGYRITVKGYDEDYFMDDPDDTVEPIVKHKYIKSKSTLSTTVPRIADCDYNTVIIESYKIVNGKKVYSLNCDGKEFRM